MLTRPSKPGWNRTTVQGTPGKLAAPLPTLGRSPLQGLNKLVNTQFDNAQSRLDSQKGEAQRSALENAQRVAAMRGTTGAGFETKIQQDAVNDVNKQYGDQSNQLASDRAGALMQAKQMKEGARQFDFGANLQKFTAANEMDINKMVTFINAATAFKQAKLDSPSAWKNLFSGGAFQSVLQQGGIGTPTYGYSEQRKTL